MSEWEKEKQELESRKHGSWILGRREEGKQNGVFVLDYME